MIYLDNAATTYPKPECVYEALDKANRNLAFNSGRGSYRESNNVHNMISETKNKLGFLLGIRGDLISFESSATESLNLIINGLDLQGGDTVYISPFEHNAIVRPLYNIKKNKAINIEVLPFNKKTWEIDVEKMNNMFAIKQPKAVFLTHISNVTGYILPYDNVFKISKKYDSINVLDCSQSLGILNPEIENLDFVVFAGHKSLYASFGVAGFYNLTGQKLVITKSGGTGSDSLNHYMAETGSERYEAGSTNSVAIAGLHESLNWLSSNNVLVHERELTEYLIGEMEKLDNIKLYLPSNKERILGIVSFNVNGYSPDETGMILDQDFDISVRTGYHCSPFVHEFLGTIETNGTVRVSIGYFTTKDDIKNLIKALKEI